MTTPADRRAGTWERRLTTALVSITVIILSALGKIAWEMNNNLQVIPAEISSMRDAIGELKTSIKDISNGYLPRNEALVKFHGIEREHETLEKRVTRLEQGVHK